MATTEQLLGTRPEDGHQTLPILTLSRGAYAANTSALLRFAERHGVLLAPHVKTAMITELALSFVQGGGWGVTVADIRQAKVMADVGTARILIANEIGGSRAAQHLLNLTKARTGTRFFVFVDSLVGLDALVRASRAAGGVRNLSVLIEVGGARAGVRNIAEFQRIASQLVAASTSGLEIGGVAAYEAASVTADQDETIGKVDQLMIYLAEAHSVLRTMLPDERRLMVTAGGSMFLDRVLSGLSSLIGKTSTDVILRPGAILFGDHGMYRRALTTMDARGGAIFGPESSNDVFEPALRVWAEVLSRPEPGLAILGVGMRGVSFDNGFPVPLARYRNGDRTVQAPGSATVFKLNDQHAFVRLEEADMEVGDVVELGISHPCTCMHLWREVHTLDRSGIITGTLYTHF